MSISRRVAVLLPDALAAGVWAWTWLHPLSWHRLTVGILVLALLIEFLAIQAGPFVGSVVYGRQMGVGASQRRRDAVVLALSALGVAALAGAAFGSWLPSALTLWLFGVKLYVALLARDAQASGREPEMHRWMLSNCAYFAAVFGTMFVRVPQLGVIEDGAYYGLRGRYEWANAPHEAVAAGALYFALLVLIRVVTWPGRAATRG